MYFALGFQEAFHTGVDSAPSGNWLRYRIPPNQNDQRRPGEKEDATRQVSKIQVPIIRRTRVTDDPAFDPAAASDADSSRRPKCRRFQPSCRFATTNTRMWELAAS